MYASGCDVFGIAFVSTRKVTLVCHATDLSACVFGRFQACRHAYWPPTYRVLCAQLRHVCGGPSHLGRALRSLVRHNRGAKDGKKLVLVTREAEQPNNGQVGLTACSSSPPRMRRARW